MDGRRHPGDAGAAGARGRGARADLGAGGRDRCGQGQRHGVHAGGASVPAGQAPDQGVGGAGHHGRDQRARRSPGGPGGREGDGRVHLRLLAGVLLPAGGGWPGGAAGQRSGGQERPGAAQDRPAGCGLAGEADRAGHAAAQLRAPAEIRQLRDDTRLRADLTQERARYWQRLEKLLEDALIKVSSVASTLDGLSVRDMLEALIAGERDPRVLAGLARGKLKAKHGALAEALAGRFDDHHAELARMLLDQIDTLGGQIGTLTTRIQELIAAIPAAQGVDADGTTGPGAGSSPDAVVLPAVARLDAVTGIGPGTAQVLLAELGLDMGVFPTPGQLVSWARLSPRTLQSGAKTRGGKTGKGNPYLKGVLGEAAAAAAKTDTFLGERYRRLVKRRGKRKALVAIARSILVIVWHLLADPAARYHDLGAGYWADRIDKGKKARNHIRQLEALGSPSPS